MPRAWVGWRRSWLAAARNCDLARVAVSASSFFSRNAAVAASMRRAMSSWPSSICSAIWFRPRCRSRSGSLGSTSLRTDSSPSPMRRIMRDTRMMGRSTPRPISTASAPPNSRPPSVMAIPAASMSRSRWFSDSRENSITTWPSSCGALAGSGPLRSSGSSSLVWAATTGWISRSTLLAASTTVASRADSAGSLRSAGLPTRANTVPWASTMVAARTSASSSTPLKMVCRLAMLPENSPYSLASATWRISERARCWCACALSPTRTTRNTAASKVATRVTGNNAASSMRERMPRFVRFI